MAQTKTRTSTKRPQAKRPQNSKRAKQATSRKQTRARARSSSESRSNGRTRLEEGKAQIKAARHTVERSAKDAGQAAGKAASKAKTPLVAGGTALAGAAVGIAIGAMRSRNSRSHGLLGLRARPHKIHSRDVAKAARGVGTLSRHVGEVATELSDDDGRRAGQVRRSPVEVVLDGLTARR